MDRRRHSSVLVVLSFSGAACDTNHYLVVAKIREGLARKKKIADISYGEVQSQEVKWVRG
jgi:hypothetical protein